jgi:hypothetical protein
VVDRHEVVVAEHDQRSRLDLPELRRGEGRLCAFQRGCLLHHHAKALCAVGGDLAKRRSERLDRRVDVELARARDQAVAVEAATDQHEPAHDVRSAQRDQQRDEGAGDGRTEMHFQQHGYLEPDHCCLPCRRDGESRTRLCQFWQRYRAWSTGDVPPSSMTEGSWETACTMIRGRPHLDHWRAAGARRLILVANSRKHGRGASA